MYSPQSYCLLRSGMAQRSRTAPGSSLSRPLPPRGEYESFETRRRRRASDGQLLSDLFSKGLAFTPVNEAISPPRGSVALPSVVAARRDRRPREVAPQHPSAYTRLNEPPPLPGAYPAPARSAARADGRGALAADTGVPSLVKCLDVLAFQEEVHGCPAAARAPRRYSNATCASNATSSLAGGTPRSMSPASSMWSSLSLTPLSTSGNPTSVANEAVESGAGPESRHLGLGFGLGIRQVHPPKRFAAPQEDDGVYADDEEDEDEEAAGPGRGLPHRPRRSLGGGSRAQRGQGQVQGQGQGQGKGRTMSEPGSSRPVLAGSALDAGDEWALAPHGDVPPVWGRRFA